MFWSSSLPTPIPSQFIPWKWCLSSVLFYLPLCINPESNFMVVTNIKSRSYNNLTDQSFINTVLRITVLI